MVFSFQFLLAFPRSDTSINCSTQHITFHMKFYKRSYSRKRTFTIKRLKSKYNNRRQLISNQLSPSLLQFILVKFKNCLSAPASNLHLHLLATKKCELNPGALPIQEFHEKWTFQRTKEFLYRIFMHSNSGEERFLFR